MTVTTFLNYKEYQANGSTRQFCIPFLLLERGDLDVFINNQQILSGYTVTGLGNPYSEIIFEQAPTGILLLQRSIDLMRETDYQENGDLLAKTLNRDFDRLYLAMQGFSQDTTQALRVKDPEGVAPLPLASERANKVLGFDQLGQPLLTTIATGSAAELAKSLVDSSDENKGASLVGYNKKLNYPTRTVGAALNRLEGSGVPLFTTSWWPSRTNIPAGYVAADGHELPRATYPEAAQAITDNKVPTVSDSVWLSNPSTRGCYVSVSREGYFRLPDYNGMQTDSLGALFVRGSNSGVADGIIQGDAIRNIAGDYGSILKSNGSATGPFELKNSGTYLWQIGQSGTGDGGFSFDASRVVPTAEENRPINVTGCWIIKLFGALVNVGSADAAQLATDYANLMSRIIVLESIQQQKRFTIIYPNGGTAENPANIASNKRYVVDNPFPDSEITCEVQIFENGMWGNPRWFFSLGGIGAKATFISETNEIIIQTGSRGVGYKYSAFIGDPFGQNIDVAISVAPARVKVWRVD